MYNPLYCPLLPGNTCTPTSFSSICNKCYPYWSRTTRYLFFFYSPSSVFDTMRYACVFVELSYKSISGRLSYLSYPPMIVCIGCDKWLFPSRSMSSPFQSWFSPISIVLIYIETMRPIFLYVSDTTRSSLQPPSSSKAPTTVLFRPSVHVTGHKPLWTKHLGKCHKSHPGVNTGWKKSSISKNFSTRGPLTLMNTFFFMSQVIAHSEHLSQWTLRVTCHKPWTVGRNSTVP